MHLERVLIVVEQRICQDGSYPGFDIRHMEGPLKSCEIVDNIDVLYYNDYSPNCDDALIDYCLQKKPQVVLLSLQNRALRNGVGPTPDAVRRITHRLHIPTVMFWFDIHSDVVAEVLETYIHSATLNMLLGADASSHKALPLEGTNHIYAGITFDERLFSKSEGLRDIPVGFFGSLKLNRSQWITGLRKFGISPYIGGGTAGWMSYEEYLGLMSRVRIALNFSSIRNPKYQPIVSPNRERALKKLRWSVSALERSYSGLKRVISAWRNPVPAVEHIISVLRNPASKEPRYQIRARVWESLWCRTFLLEEDNPVTSIYFEPYVDYVPFTTLEDLVDKIRYYLENDEERDRIRMNGWATVKKHHNARTYWQSLFETIGIQPAAQYYHRPGEIWSKAYFDNWYSKQVLE